jgi:hypothetical protein
MNDEFSAVSFKNWGFFAGTIVLTTLVVAGLYGWLYGFSYLEKSAVGAGRVLVAAFNGQPTTVQPVQPLQPVYPQVNVPVVQYQPQYQPQVVQQPLQAGQFVCPSHGSVGMPLYGQGGVPQCPVCGQVMQFFNSGYQGTTAAWGGQNRQLGTGAG